MPATTEQTEHPIIFNSWSIRRILANEKTQTRRLIPEINDSSDEWESGEMMSFDMVEAVARFLREEDGLNIQKEVTCPYGRPGDVLWVREAFRLPEFAGNNTPSEHVSKFSHPDCHAPVLYIAGGHAGEADGNWGRKRPSIHMPRELCRLRLRVAEVRVERVQGIESDDVDAEGVANRPDPDGAPWQKWETADGPETNFAHIAFRTLWNDIHGDGAWDENPWVWVVSFSQITE